MKGHAFISVLFLCAAIVGCNKSKPEAPTTTGSTPPPKTTPVSALKKLKIEDVKPGKGNPAQNGDLLTMLYIGKLENGTVFDGNMGDDLEATPGKDPFALTLGMGMVIKGWDEGLVGMKIGGVRKLSIPAELGYGSQSKDPIPPNSDLYFTVKCLDIIKKGEELVIDIDDVKPGAGPAVKKGDKITVHYVGTLLNGKQFDSSRDKNTPFEFVAGNGEVVPGFDKGVLGMKKGGVRKVRIPPQAAYGADPSGGIPANSVLFFEIELLKINGK